MLKLENLTVKIEGKTILKNVYLELHPGEVVLLTGSNGSGKTTLLRAIAGDPRLDVEGKIILDGEDITQLNPAERFKKGIFLTFQLVPDFEGLKVLDILQSLNLPISDAKELFNRLGLNESFLYHELKGLSGGERKKFEIVQAFLTKQKYILLDEIDSGVDVESLKKIFELIIEMADSGKGVLYVSHSPFVRSIAHRVISIKGGVLLEDSRKT